ncbi:MAG TPA: hypothetical protein PKK26_10935 [Candidatus Wallbacteria bacterium]|nr:hypothetical protein [Candidatus Wallbacteria bacterium]
MTKKNIGKETNNIEDAGAEIFIDKKTMEIIDAQCADKNIERGKFVMTAVRLYLDFNYMAHMVGKDIFAFRDDMIKAIIKSKGDDGAAQNVGEAANSGTPADAPGQGDAASSIFKEIAELKKIVLELKKTVENRSDESGADRREREKRQNCERGDAGHAKKQSLVPISVEKIAMEFKDSNPPTYKEKRKKLDKLKF